MIVSVILDRLPREEKGDECSVDDDDECLLQWKRCYPERTSGVDKGPRDVGFGCLQEPFDS